MRTLILTFLCFFSTISFAQAPAKKKRVDPVTEQKILEAVNYNFDACNREDIEDVMDSCADAMPRREEFRRETLRVFNEKDIHYSLVDLEVLQIKYPFVLVRMVQKSHTDDRESEPNIASYRNQTALVTEEDCVEYLNTLKCENGKWKLLTIVSEMKPYVEKKPAEEKVVEVEKPKQGVDCRNGNCSVTPFTVKDLSDNGFEPARR